MLSLQNIQKPLTKVNYYKGEEERKANLGVRARECTRVHCLSGDGKDELLNRLDDNLPSGPNPFVFSCKRAKDRIEEVNKHARLCACVCFSSSEQQLWLDKFFLPMAVMLSMPLLAAGSKNMISAFVYTYWITGSISGDLGFKSGKRQNCKLGGGGTPLSLLSVLLVS